MLHEALLASFGKPESPFTSFMLLFRKWAKHHFAVNHSIENFTMGKKNSNGSKKRDKRNLRRVQENLLQAVEQEGFNEEFRWYREVLEGEASDPNLEEQQSKDKKEVSTMEDNQKDGPRAVFPSTDVRFK